MALLTKFNKKAKAASETGLSADSSNNAGRFFNKDGKPNITVHGIGILNRLNVYHTLLSLPTWKFISIIFVAFTIINIFFTGLYLAIGISHLSGIVAKNWIETFCEVFFFSAQTFTTVGYGRVNPVGLTGGFLASFEALIGLMCFALITGLLYGRFAQPRAYLAYSTNAIFAPYKNGVALMFRMAPYTRNYLINAEVQLTLALRIMEEGVVKNKYFTLKTEVPKAATLMLNWTIVHAITEDSPFYGLTMQDLENAHAEIMVFVQGFDESFSNTVVSRHSYVYNEFVIGAKFVPMYHPNTENNTTILELHKLNVFEKVDIPKGFIE